MSTGKQLAELLLLSTALTFPGFAHAQDAGEPAGTDAEVTGEAAPEEQDEQYEEPDISIPGGAIVVTGRRIRDIGRISTQVVSVLSTEQIARTGEGDIAGALGRVTGLSVQGQGYVFVRGLGDRYSLALLNGLPLPSPQPLSRVVPLDIFPTNIVASSLVQKTYSANFPGEFGGGVINLTTRAIPDEPFLKISAGISGDSETTGRKGFTHYGSDSDWSGFDDGTRNAPPALRDYFRSGERMSDLDQDAQETIAKDLIEPNIVALQRTSDLPVNFSGSITAGTAFDVGSDGRLGIIASAAISNKWRNRDITSQTAVNGDLDLDTDFRDFTTDNRVLVNALLGFGLEIGEHKFRWTNLYIRDTLKQSSLSIGTDFQNDYTDTVQNTAWYERQLIDTQFVGEMKFGDWDVDLRGGFAQTQREAPYEYEFEYTRTNNPNDPYGNLFVNVLDRQRGNASVTFSKLKEELWYGGLDLSHPLTDWMTATIGYAYSDTSRYSERREFLFNAPTTFPDGVGTLMPLYLLGDAVIDYFDIGLIETTESDPAFDAGLEIHAGYGQLRIEPASGLTIDVGVRYEDAKQTVNPVSVFSAPLNSTAATNLANDYFLPAATITYDFDNGLQARVSASKTIARPQFRELIFQTYYDPDTNRQFNGNPLLQDSELINAEARLEYYWGRGNRVSVAGFYKDIDKPIEAYSSFSDNERITSFANAPKAQLYGAEIELQYNYDLYDLGGWFDTKRAVLIANYTYTQSDIKVSDGDTTLIYPGGVRNASDFFDDGVPLTGQSDHLLNLQFGIEDTDKLQQFTFLLSYESERVTSRGAGSLPDIKENPGLRLDFVAREEVELLKLPVELKFEIRNITGRGHEEFQSNGTRRIEINSYDVGTSVSASASVKF